MEKYESKNIKIGILSDIRRQIIKGNAIFRFSGKKRAILFEDNDLSYGQDILYPELYYPYNENKDYKTRTSVISEFDSLAPILNYYSLFEPTKEELERFSKYFLARESWLEEVEALFGKETRKYGPLKATSSRRTGGVFPSSLYDILSQVPDITFNLTRKEVKMLGLKK